MHLVTVRLDRIFDVVQLRYEGKDVTLFGFQYGLKRVFGVSAPGRPILEEGNVLTAYLGEDGDWTTLKGWYNHSKDVTVLDGIGNEVFFIAVTIAVLVGMLTGFDDAPGAAWLLPFIMTMYSCWCIRTIYFLSRIRAKLRQLKDEPLPTLALPPEAVRL